MCFPGGLVVKNPPVNAGDSVLTPGSEDPLEKEIATHDWSNLACMHALEKEMATHSSIFFFGTPVFLPGESQGQRSLVGCHLWGHTESDTTEAT